MNRILYVITLYGCMLEEAATFKTLFHGDKNYFKDIFVYDNSPMKQNESIKVGKYIHDICNGGLGKAYNAACVYAKENGYQWLMLLDQDTYFPENAIENYNEAIVSQSSVSMITPRHIIENGKFISPTPYHMFTSHVCTDAPTGIVKFSDASPINSGMLVSVESFCHSGGYYENIWLDFSDVAFIEKYKKLYHEYYVMANVICRQTFSGIETDKKKIYQRFCIYLECARNFRKCVHGISLALTVATIRPTLSRTLKTLNLKYIFAYFKYYLGSKENRHG